MHQHPSECLLIPAVYTGERPGGSGSMYLKTSRGQSMWVTGKVTSSTAKLSRTPSEVKGDPICMVPFCNQQRAIPLNEEKYFWAFFGQRIPGIPFNLHHLWPIFNIPPSFLQRRSGTTRQSTPEPTRMGRSMAREGRKNISNVSWGDIVRYQQYCSVCIRRVHHISFGYLFCQVWMAWWFCVWRGVPQQQCGESQSCLHVSSNRFNLVQPWLFVHIHSFLCLRFTLMQYVVSYWFTLFNTIHNHQKSFYLTAVTTKTPKMKAAGWRWRHLHMEGGRRIVLKWHLFAISLCFSLTPFLLGRTSVQGPVGW